MKLNNLKFSPLLIALLVTLLMGTASGCTTPECQDHKDPGAQLSVSPNPADINERVKFDATGSYDHDGRIVKYLFDFDNDGVYDRVDYDGVAYKRFKTSGSKKTKVKVVDNDGRSSTATKIYRVENTAQSCRMISGFLHVEEDDLHQGESTEAYINAYNYGKEQKVRVTFKLDGVTVSESTKVVNKESNARFSTSVSPEGDSRLKAFVDTVGGPCGDEEINQKYKDISVVSQPEQEEAKLKTVVVNQDGEQIQNARVSVSGQESNLKYTNSEGRTSMRLDPGSYRVEVTKDRHTTYENSVDLQEGQTDTLHVTLRNRHQESELKVRTEDETGDSLENSKIIVKNGEEQTKYTSSDGETSFSLKSGTYEVTAEKDGYGLKQRTLELESGERHSTTFEMSERPPSEPEEANLRVHVEDDDGDDLESARVEVADSDTESSYTNRYGDTDFVLQPGIYEVRVSKSGYSTEYRTIELDEGGDRTLNFELQDRQSDPADLQVQVKSEDGDRLEDARVKVADGFNRQKRTDNWGRADFQLPSGRYTVTASKSGYVTRERTVSLDSGEDESVSFSLRETDNDGDDGETSEHISLDQATFSSRVCRGDDLDVRLRVSNTGDSSQRVSLGVRGLGDRAIDQFTVAERDSRSRTLTLNNVQGSGSERIRIAVTNGNTDIEMRTVQVQDCNNGGGTDPGDGDGDSGPSSVSMRVNPQEIQVGNSVRVTGHVDGVRGSADVTITADGRRMSDIATEPDGYYEDYIRPETVGNVEVTARSGSKTARQKIKVLPTVTLSSMDAPRKVFETDTFQVCTNVESQVTPLVILERDGERIDSKNAEGQVCFITEAEDPGETEYTVRASANGVSDSINRNIEVLEMGDEVENFPDKVAMVRSGEGIVRVSLYNTDDDSREYDLELGGVPDDWFAQTEKSATLQSGEKERIYFYITPKAEGTFYPELTVEADGSEVHNQEIRVRSGGTLDSGKTWRDKIIGLLRW